MVGHTIFLLISSSLFLCLPTSAILEYAHVGPYDICDEELSWQNIPVLPFGYIRTPDYPHPTVDSYNCAITIRVERESWMGIYARSFSLVPGENCIGSNELQITSSVPGLSNHFCGVQKGLIYSKYMPTTDSFIHLHFISLGGGISSGLFEMYYIAAKAVHVGANNSSQLEANTVGHIVSHRYFSESQGQGYTANVHASLTLTGFETGSMIELELIYFDVYRQDNNLPCTDYLEVIDAKEITSESPLERLCGWRNDNTTLVVNSNRVTFIFSTGRKNNGNKGFLIRYAVVGNYVQTTTTYYSTYMTNTDADKNVKDLNLSTTDLKLQLSSVKLPATTSHSPDATTPSPTSHMTSAANHTWSAREQKKEGEYTIALSAGLGSLIVVLVIVIVVVIATRRRTQVNNADGCYADNIFAVRNLPSTFDPVSNAGHGSDEDNIYYNDLEVFETHANVVRSSSPRGQCNEDNVYHIIEKTAPCHCKMEAREDNHEYENCPPSHESKDLQVCRPAGADCAENQHLAPKSLDKTQC